MKERLAPTGGRLKKFNYPEGYALYFRVRGVKVKLAIPMDEYPINYVPIFYYSLCKKYTWFEKIAVAYYYLHKYPIIEEWDDELRHYVECDVPRKYQREIFNALLVQYEAPLWKRIILNITVRFHG